MTEGRFDVLVVGSGFAGSLLAWILTRRGLKVILVEQGRHPRWTLGEATSPMANLALGHLARVWNLPEMEAFTRYGSWRLQAPWMPCGLKRGFTFLHHDLDAHWSGAPGRRRLVAASPSDETSDMNWHRSHLDAWLAERAQAAGATLHQETSVSSLVPLPRSGGWRANLEPRGTQGQNPDAWDVEASFLVDASGAGALSAAFGLVHPLQDGLPALAGGAIQGRRTFSLHGHFSTVKAWARSVGLGSPEGPFADDDAALHHVFEGGWIWVLRLGTHDGREDVSVGATLDEARWGHLPVDPQLGWDALLARLPAVARHLEGATALRPMGRLAPVARRQDRAWGPDLALLPHAAGFVDPLFSTGIPMSLLAIHRLAETLVETEPGSARDSRVEQWGRQSLAERDHVARLVAGSWACMGHPELFDTWSNLYFVAASHGEVLWRLDRIGPDAGFLMSRNAEFLTAFDAMERVLPAALADPAGGPALLRGTMVEHLGPLDVAGMTRVAPDNIYPVRLGDLLAAAGRFGLTEAEMREHAARWGIGAESQ